MINVEKIMGVSIDVSNDSYVDVLIASLVRNGYSVFFDEDELSVHVSGPGLTVISFSEEDENTKQESVQ